MWAHRRARARSASGRSSGDSPSSVREKRNLCAAITTAASGSASPTSIRSGCGGSWCGSSGTTVGGSVVWTTSAMADAPIGARALSAHVEDGVGLTQTVMSG